MLAVVLMLAATAGADWRQFRGNRNDGVATPARIPITWNESQNIAWKVDLPGRGPSSPIVVGDRVVVTCSSGANQDRLHVLCFNVTDGRRRWHRQFWATGRTLCHPSSAVAAPTPASDGRRIFAFYSSNDLACLDLDGNLQWFRGLAFDFPKAGNDVGMASSPVVVDGTVVVQIENQGDSFVAGIDAVRGTTRWRLPRDRQANWASPAVAIDGRGAGDLVVLQSPSGLSVHDPLTGLARWNLSVACQGIPSPVASGGVVYASAEGITAVAVTQVGSRSQALPLWQENRLRPGSASPLVHQGKIYVINSAG
ncbi:MAG: PQQ-binding-like beta-propeller repeat protein, partial [Pirellulales bacterium]